MNKIIANYKMIKTLKELMISAAYSMDNYDYFREIGADVEITVFDIEKDIKDVAIEIIDDIIGFCHEADMLVENGIEYREAMEIAKELFVGKEEC